MRIPQSTLTRMQMGAAGRVTAQIPPRDYSYLNEQDSQLRVWLPDPAKQGLEELCEIAETSMTAYLTEYFATYLFGQHEVMRMRATKSGIYEPQPERRYCAMTPGLGSHPVGEPDLGKNIFALKIWIPEKMKKSLQFHAQRSKVSLGEFIRVLICAHLFGCEYLPTAYLNIGPSDIKRSELWEAETDE